MFNPLLLVGRLVVLVATLLPTLSLANQAIWQTIVAEATYAGIPVGLVDAVIHAESGYDSRAVSPKGAQGLMQLMPGTAARFGVSDVFDPAQNIRGGVAYLAWLYQRYQDWSLTLAAYNAGEGAVDKYGGIPPYRETRNYVRRVLARYGKHSTKAELPSPLPQPPSPKIPSADPYTSSVFFR